MIPKSGNRFSKKIMRKAKICEAKEEIMAAQSYDRLEGVIWYDGKLVPWADANLHVLSHGLHYASAVFEGERAYGGLRSLPTPLRGGGDPPRKKGGGGKEWQPGSLCAPGRLARLRNDGRL